MKIGTSISTCIMDIVNGKVREEDVAFIITSVRYPSREHIFRTSFMMIEGRHSSDFIDVASRMWDQGKIFQSSNPEQKPKFDDIWIDTDVRIFEPEPVTETPLSKFPYEFQKIPSWFNSLVESGNHRLALTGLVDFAKKLSVAAASHSSEIRQNSPEPFSETYDPAYSVWDAVHEMIFSHHHSIKKLVDQLRPYINIHLDYDDGRDRSLEGISLAYIKGLEDFFNTLE